MMWSSKIRQRLSRSPNLEKVIDPERDVLAHLEEVLRKERENKRRRKKTVAGDPHQPNDWSFLKPLRLPKKPLPPILQESPPAPKPKAPPPHVHSPNKPIEPYGGWSRAKRKKKKAFTITLPKSALKSSKGTKRKQEMHSKSKKRGNSTALDSTSDDAVITFNKRRKAKKAEKGSGKVKRFKGMYQWRRRDNKFVIIKFRINIAEKDTEEEIAKAWDKFLFEAQNHGRTINTDAFNFPKDLPTRRKRSRTRVYYQEYADKLARMTESQIEQLQEPLNPPKNKSVSYG